MDPGEGGEGVCERVGGVEVVMESRRRERGSESVGSAIVVGGWREVAMEVRGSFELGVEETRLGVMGLAVGSWEINRRKEVCEIHLSLIYSSAWATRLLELMPSVLSVPGLMGEMLGEKHKSGRKCT